MAAIRTDVVVIGNAIVDIMRRCEDEFLTSTGVPKGQMSLVDSPATIAGICRTLTSGIEVAGGSAANTAVGIASFGGRAAFIGKVAEDQFGRIFRHDIRGSGVTFETPAVAISGKATSHSLILVTPDGKRTMNTFLGVSTEFNEELIDAEMIRNSKIVYLEGYLFDRPEAKAAFRRAVSIASSTGRIVALSLSDPFCVDRHRDDFLGLIRSGVGVLFANESEIASLYQVRNFDDALGFVGRDIAMAVLTRSEKGSVIVSKGQIIEVPIEAVSRIVDMTGAGDLYAAGFLYGLSNSFDLMTSGRLGSFAATEIISQIGARPEARLGNLARLRGLFNKRIA